MTTFISFKSLDQIFREVMLELSIVGNE